MQTKGDVGVDSDLLLYIVCSSAEAQWTVKIKMEQKLFVICLVQEEEEEEEEEKEINTLIC